MKTTSTFKLVTATAVAALSVATAAFAADPDSCSTVHFSDVGWTDITATTATASIVLKASAIRPTSRFSPCRSPTIAEEQGHRRLPRQLDADAGEGRSPLSRRQVGRIVRRRTWSAPSTRSPPTPRVRNSASRTSRISPPTRTISTARSTASSRAMTATACHGHDREGQVRPEGYGSRRILRTGHAGAGRARRQGQASPSSSSAGSRIR